MQNQIQILNSDNDRKQKSIQLFETVIPFSREGRDPTKLTDSNAMHRLVEITKDHHVYKRNTKKAL